MIRTRYTATPTTVLPAFLSASAWPGFRPWLLSVLSSIGIFSLLAGFAWHGTNSRMPDMTTLLVAVPASMLTMIIVAAALWTVLTRAPLEAGLAFIARLLPLAWLAPLLDLLSTVGKGVVVSATPLDGSGFWLAAVTASLLPASSAIPLGLRVGILSAVLITAFVVWFSQKNLIRSIIAALVMSAGIVKLSFLSSALGVWYALVHGEGWVQGSAETARATLRAVTNGYWWNNIYDRFPSAIDSQADIAVRLTSSGLAALSLGIVLAALCVWRAPRWKQFLIHSLRSWSSFHLALYPIGGALFYAIAANTPALKGTWWYAIALGVLGLAALRFHTVCERRLHQANTIASDSDDSLAQGDIAPALLSDLSLIALIYA